MTDDVTKVRRYVPDLFINELPTGLTNYNVYPESYRQYIPESMWGEYYGKDKEEKKKDE